MDTFFSGSSDVALPERGGRRMDVDPDRSGSDLEARAPYFCERCDESIPLQELASGRARLIYGLSFCVRCAPLLEEEKYQIYFCDRCRVSIPLERIEGGEALAGDGHVYCERCRRRPSRPARIARRAAIPAAVLLALLGATTALVWWPRAPRPVSPDFGTELRATRERLEGLWIDRAEGRRALLQLDAERRRLGEETDRAEVLLERVRALEAILVPAESPHPDGSERR